MLKGVKADEFYTILHLWIWTLSHEKDSFWKYISDIISTGLLTLFHIVDFCIRISILKAWPVFLYVCLDFENEDD